MTPDDLDAIVTRAASVYPEDAGWDGDEAERALTTVTRHVPALAAALREAWAERDGARVASTPNEREAMLRAALDNREAYARDLAALVTHSDQRIAELAQERDAAVATVRALNADIAAAAGELRVPIPTPGSDAARMLRANIILRQERDEARAERRAARLDRDAAEERVAELQRLAGGQR